jgi:hypothetical protein
MPITVQLEDERRTALQSLPRGPLTNWLLQAALPPETVCLRFIDTHGDTVFNHLQMTTLHAELQRAKPLITDESLAHAYDDFVARAAQRGPTVEAYARKSPRPQPEQLRDHITALQRLIDHALAQPRTYIRFIGD